MKYCILLLGLAAIAAAPTLSLYGQSPTETSCFEGLNRFAEAYKVQPGEQTEGNGIALLPMDCIRQKGNREFPYPIEGHTLVVNPPVLTWPMADYVYPEVFPAPPSEKSIDDYLHYDVQLGRNHDLSGKEDKEIKGLKMPFYHPHKALEPGRWYWRYRVSGGTWSAIHYFDVSEDIPLFESPDVDEAAHRLPKAHPVIFRPYALPQPLTADQQALIKQLYKKAKVAMDKSTESYKVQGQPIPAHATASEREQILRFHLRYEVEAICRSIQELLTVYRLDGDERYLQRALQLSDTIAAKDPVATYAMADFTGARCMSTLAMTYDVAYRRLTAAQRKAYESFIREVGERVLGHALQENIGSADGILCAHFFQHTFVDAFKTALVMKNDLPQAETWFNLLYEIWLSRSPGGGFLSDGVWPNGNMGYIHVNMESMVENFLLFRDLFGVNIFRHPWYRNCAEALAYTAPVGSPGDGFGDDSESVYIHNNLRGDFAYILGEELHNPIAREYAYRWTGQNQAVPYRFVKTNFTSYRLQHQPRATVSAYKGNRLQSVVFPQTGIVAMNTDVEHSDRNLFVSFRSSPFGVGSHGLAEQNSFNLSCKGKPIFYPTGYRITTADRHYLLSQKHSRARNTVTVNGKTQAYSHSAYGWIARYLDGRQMTYALGDASKAYVPFDISAINWETVLRQANAYTAEEGFILSDEDDPKVKLFRRHLTMLRPRIVVVYDELEAEKEVTWTFQLNGLERSHMQLDASNVLLTADTDNADAQVKVLGSTPLFASLTDTSYVKPFDWLNPQRGRPAKQFEAHQYHSRFENVTKCRKMRFLALIQVDESNSMHFLPVVPDEEGVVTLGDYRIRGELDTTREACLEIEHIPSGEYLLYGAQGKMRPGVKRSYSHSTLLFSPDGGWQESIDRYPLMVPDLKTLQRQTNFVQK